MPERLLRILHNGGLDLAGPELLDALWLATRIPAASDDNVPEAAQNAPTAADGPGQDDTADRPGRLFPSESGAEGIEDLEPRTSPRRRTRARPRARGTGTAGAGNLFSDAQPREDRAPARPAVPALAPDAKALADSLSLSRALRPLRGHRPSPVRVEVDEAATVTAMAESGLADVISKPARERHLDLALIIDDGISMLLWQRLSGEVRTLTERLGIFRDVRVHGLDTRGSARPALRAKPFAEVPAVGEPSALVDPRGATLTLVVSDGIGAAWRDGRMAKTLAFWGRRGPTAIVHVLPPQLWDGSAIRADRWEVTSHAKAAPNSAWRVSDPLLPPALCSFRGMPIPVLTPRASSLAEWAQLIASPGRTAVLPLMRTDPESVRSEDGFSGAQRPAEPSGSAADDPAFASVMRFRGSVSPEAYRLAAHLAAVTPVSVPAMRLVQECVPWKAETAQLAEVFSGGLMEPANGTELPGIPHRLRQFDFPETTKAVLLDIVPTSELVATGIAVGRRMDSLVGRSRDFPAWLPHPAGEARIPEHAREFAWIGASLLTRLGFIPGPRTGVPQGLTGSRGVPDRPQLPHQATDARSDAGPAIEEGLVAWPGDGPRATVLDTSESMADLVRQSMGGASSAAQSLPTFLYLGPRGSGKTTLLDVLEDTAHAASSGACVARVDIQALSANERSPVGALLQIAGQLTTAARDSTARGFPAFAGTLLYHALAATHGFDEGVVERFGERARAAIDSEERSDRSRRLREILRESLDTAFTWAGEQLPRGLAVLALLLPDGPEAASVLGGRQDAATLRDCPGSSEDLIPILDGLTREGTDGRQRFLELVFRAFLTDLEDAHGNSRPGGALHSLLLLDNVDCQAGEGLLALLTEARTLGAGRVSRVAPGQDIPADPLLAIATARTLPSRMSHVSPEGMDVGFARWWFDSSSTSGVRDDLVVEELAGLNVDEVTEHAEKLLRSLPSGTVLPPVRDPEGWLGQILYDLTAGHPGTVTTLTDALRDFPTATDWAHRLRALFTSDDPAHGVVPALLDSLLEGVPRSLRELLTRACGAADLDQAFSTWNLWGDLDQDSWQELSGFRDRQLFTVAQGDGPPRLRPVLRLPLLRRLSARSSRRAFTWRRVHDALRLNAHDHGDLASAAYHSLAMGDVPTAAAHLHRRLDETDAAHWLAEFELVRRAPIRNYTLIEGQQPRETFLRYTRHLGEKDIQAAVTRALAACWLVPDAPPASGAGPRDATTRLRPFGLVGDPLADPYGELFPEVVRSAAELASLHPTARHLYQDLGAHYTTRY